MPSKPPPAAQTTPRWIEGYRRRVPFYIAIAILLAFLTAYLAFNYLDQIRKQEHPVFPVVIAASDLSAGSSIAADDVRLFSIAEELRPLHAYDDLSDAIGKDLARSIQAKEILLPTDFVGEPGSGLSAKLPVGSWGLILPTTWFVAPLRNVVTGDRIDLLAYQPGQPLEEARILVSGLYVLEVSGSPSTPEQLILLVTYEEASVILYCHANGFQLLPLLQSQGG